MNHSDFIFPAYNDYCFSNLPDFIKRIFGANQKPGRQSFPQDIFKSAGDNIERIVLVFFDAFGWEALQKYSNESELLKRFDSDGEIFKITSQFPSTTVAHVTTLMTGQPVYDSGIYEWYYYEPKVEQVINIFNLCSYNRMGSPGSLLNDDLKAKDILPSGSFFQDLKSLGVTSYLYQFHRFSHTPYNLHFYPRDHCKAFANYSQAVAELLNSVGNSKEKEYHQFYIHSYDDACHHHGPNSNMADRSATEILDVLQKLEGLAKDGKTLLVLTADHGQVAISRDKEIFINQQIPDLIPRLRHTANGQVIRFAGSPRDLFLHADERFKNELHAEIREKLQGIATVYSLDEAISLNLLGPQPISQNFLERIGNILILPHTDYSVCWHEPGVYERHFLNGHHGGLSPQEMEIPLCLLRL